MSNKQSQSLVLITRDKRAQKTGADFWAADFHSLGYAPDKEIYDTQKRFFPLSRAEVIKAIV